MSRKKKHRLSGDQALNQAFAAVDHQPLLTALGVDISEDLLRLALTHRSFANEHGHLPNNERLEFLGDAVLGMSIAARLYREYPDKAESDISKMRASMVSRYGLADIARDIDLGKHILLGRGETSSGGHDKDSILADTTEALFGAIYLEHGFHAARDVILRLFSEKIAHASAAARSTDWKTALQEAAALRKLPMPEYTSSSVGPDHERTYTADAVILGVVLGTGTGGNKKTAEQQAAHIAHNKLSDREQLAELYNAAQELSSS